VRPYGQPTHLNQTSITVFPQFFRLRQKFPRPLVENIPGEVDAQLARLKLGEKIRPGQTVAITCGSRGIANMATIIRAAVDHFKALRAEPYVVSAMGSHGGAKAEGQRRVLAHYGITPENMGCDVRCGMETVEVCQSAQGFPIVCDKLAMEADHLLVCNRIKPHTGFAGKHQSGLLKVMIVGLGNHVGAQRLHAASQDFPFDDIVGGVAEELITATKVVAGLAIVENAYDETAMLEVIAPRDIPSREVELLKQATKWMPRLPFERFDIVIVDEIGKNISGTGLDTNVVGRKFDDNKAVEGEFPKVRIIVTRRLTPESEGNATGVGVSDFCHRQLREAIDMEKTLVNCVTGGHIGSAKMPPDYPTDRKLIETTLQMIGLRPPKDARIAWIRNTLKLEEVECSSVFLEDAQSRDDLEVLTELRDLPLGEDGNLPNWAPTSRLKAT